MKREHFCFNCGEPLGFFDGYGDRYMTCGAIECGRAERYAHQEDRDAAVERAADDDYSAYR